MPLQASATAEILFRLREEHLGLPVCGDPAYLADGKIGPAMALDPDAPPLCLHSWKISFVHPLTKERVRFEAPAPSWAAGRDPRSTVLKSNTSGS